MAKEINNPYVGEILTRAFNLQGRVRPLLEEFIIPTVSLGDLSEGTAPPIGRRATCFITQAAVAGERWIGRFESIAGVICVMRRIFLASSAGGNFSWAPRGNAATLGALGTVAAKSFADGRILAGNPNGSAQQPSGVFTHDTAVAGIAGVVGQRDITVTGFDMLIQGSGWVVGTGHPALVGFLEMQIAANNSLVEGYLEWDEFALV